MNALKLITMLALLIFAQIGLADPLDTWTLRNPSPTGNNLTTVNDLCGAVGSGCASS